MIKFKIPLPNKNTNTMEDRMTNKGFNQLFTSNFEIIVENWLFASIRIKYQSK